MKSRAFRIAVTLIWAAVCITMILLLSGGGYFGGRGFMSGWRIDWDVRVGSELILQESADAQGVERLEVSVSHPSVRVFAVDGGAFAVRHYGPSATPEEERVQVRREGGTLRVTIPNVKVICIGFFNSQRLEIDVPRDWVGSVSASATSGGLTIEDSFAWKSAELETTSGSLRVNGALTLTETFRASATSGGVKLGTVKARSVRASTSSGHLSAQALETDAFDLSSTSGGVSADALTGGGQVKSTSGSVNIDCLHPTGAVEASATSGGVKLRIPPEYPFVFEARRTSGSIRSDYELYYQDKNNKTAYHNNGENGPIVRAETTSGSIRLNR